ncbi:7682_t:CDS:2 [Diversispora eburnea]|uniref:Deoxycytidylate deaminase n=1 Tax=Diversispora eburnea TaxID=1213867 RepID=A0A9N8ZAS3_9GLOM|nr:7682_t:CDS:2 [Diversispora eburnea]
MFIGITGPRFAGKNTVAKWLVSGHGFTLLSLRKDNYYENYHNHHSQHQGLDALEFESPEELLQYVTKKYSENFVTCDIRSSYILEVYRKRPFFLLLAVDEENHPEPPLEEFLIENDSQLFKAVAPSNEFAESFISNQSDSDQEEGGRERIQKNSSKSEKMNQIRKFEQIPVYNIMTMADLTIVNSYLTFQPLFVYLHKLEITNPERLRPSWDTYFMHLSDLAALRSNCMKRRVGCILVKDFRVIATGYNGTARGLKNCNQGGCDRCNDAVPSGAGLDKCLCLHAEENALLEAGKERVGKGSILYCNTCPCLGCSVKLIQVGVEEVVYKNSYNMDEITARLLKEAGIKLRQHAPPNRRLQLQKNE